ncbi:hypothetical protein PHLCEN_2v13661 [Hermanssonia centrifuga]|uniref:N-acetyltransferase domain-containing protein n=1 Tax=Hermanssonia centrifuga TaxID=98765 RepID=A0A2R6NDR6_9APHY|nr:hypothetical protein PHLCEN_2v13661 [Hermanssonia centrifuga]
MEDLIRLCNDLEVQKLACEDYVVPRSPNFQETIKGWVNHSLFYAIIAVKSTGEFVGNVGLSPRVTKNREATLAVTIASHHWSKGYGTEVLNFVIDYAFRSLALHRVSLGVFALNSRAVALYKKVGFVEEGRLRKATWIDGEWQDVILMAVLEDEWPAGRQKK